MSCRPTTPTSVVVSSTAHILLVVGLVHMERGEGISGKEKVGSGPNGVFPLCIAYYVLGL